MARNFWQRLRRFCRNKIRRSKRDKPPSGQGKQFSLQISAPTNFVHLTSATGNQTVAATVRTVGSESFSRASPIEAHDAAVTTAKNDDADSKGKPQEDTSDDGHEKKEAPRGTGAAHKNHEASDVSEEELTKAGEDEPTTSPTIFGSTKPADRVTIEVAEAMEQGPLAAAAPNDGNATW